jgi:hypothetical protein
VNLDLPPREIDRSTARALRRHYGALARMGTGLTLGIGFVALAAYIVAVHDPEVSEWIVVFPLPGVIVGVVLAIIGYRKYFIARRVFQLGQETTGLVVRGKVPRFFLLFSPLSWYPVKATYVFEDENGNEHTASVTVYHKKASEWMDSTIGAQCTALYDRDDPSKNLLCDVLSLDDWDGKKQA